MRMHGMLLDFIRTWYSRSAYLTMWTFKMHCQ